MALPQFNLGDSPLRMRAPSSIVTQRSGGNDRGEGGGGEK